MSEHRMSGQGTPTPGRTRTAGNRPGRSLRSVHRQRLLIDIVAPGQAGWTADLRATGIPALHSEGGNSIHVGRHAELSGLVEDLDRIVSALREWWPGLEVHISLGGSVAAARRVAVRSGLTLPR
ncbi:MAG TPA: hypothetical protein VL595_34695 [Pseudonocardia sp.]|jgi:hypothetical protein|nr:hypothetical protein [Pseudonocardia sp.]